MAIISKADPFSGNSSELYPGASHGQAWALPARAADTCTDISQHSTQRAPPAHRSERGVRACTLTSGGQGGVRSCLHGSVSGRVYVRQHQFCAHHFHGRVPDLLVQFSAPEQEFCLSSPNGAGNHQQPNSWPENKNSAPSMLVHFVKSTGRFSRGEKRS